MFSSLTNANATFVDDDGEDANVWRGQRVNIKSSNCNKKEISLMEYLYHEGITLTVKGFIDVNNNKFSFYFSFRSPWQ